MTKKYAIIYIESYYFAGGCNAPIYKKRRMCTIMELSENELNDDFINKKLNENKFNHPLSYFIDIKPI